MTKTGRRNKLYEFELFFCSVLVLILNSFFVHVYSTDCISEQMLFRYESSVQNVNSSAHVAILDTIKQAPSVIIGQM